MIYFIKNPITASAPIKALIKPQQSGAVKSLADNLPISNIAAPAIMGVESKKDKRALVLRESPKNKAAVMVMPLRDTPGIKAKAWAQPIKNTILNGTENKIFGNKSIKQ